MENVVERPQGLRPAQKSANSCDNLRAHGRCKFGDECYYAHSQEESELFREWARAVKRQQAKESGGVPPERYFRTQICVRWREGRCLNGAACTFAHGEENLRAPPRAPPLAAREGSSRWEDGPAAPSPPRPRSAPPCRFWHEYGNCRLGDECQFAHDQHLERSGSGRQQGPPGLSTPQKDREREVGEGDSRGPLPCHPDKYKSQLCTYFMDQGYCRHGEACTFAHGMHELRQPPRQPHYPREVRRGPSSDEGEFFDNWEKPRRPAAMPPGFSPAASAPPPPPPAPAADGSVILDPTPSEAASLYHHQVPPPAAIHHVPSIGPLPSLASSDGGVALSDDDFPPLASGTAAQAAPRRSPSAKSAGSMLVRTAAPGSAQSSDGPCTPSRDAGAGPASSDGSPSMASDQGVASRPLSAAGSSELGAAAPQEEGQAAGEVAAGEPAEAGPGQEGGVAAAAAGTAAGYASSSGGGSSLDGYAAGVSATGCSDYETAEEEEAAGPAGTQAQAAPAAGEEEGGVVFMAPEGAAVPSPQQVPVAVTFSPAGTLSTRSSVSDLDRTLSAVLGPQQAAPAPSPSPPPAPVASPEPTTATAVAATPQPPQLAPPAVAPAPPLPPLDVAAIHSFRCPLAKCLFTDPVVAADGFTYERAAIHDWLYRRNQDVSPVTGQPLVHKMLAPNHSVRGMVAEVAHLLRCMASGMPLPPPPPTIAAAPYPTPMPPHLPAEC